VAYLIILIGDPGGTLFFFLTMLLLSLGGAVAETSQAVQDATTFSPEPHVRLILHGTRAPVEGGAVGLSGWVIAPDIGNDPTKWVTLAGLRVVNDVLSLEFHGGLLKAGDGTAHLLDVRFGAAPKNSRLSHWSNVQLIMDPSGEGGGGLYFYHQYDLSIWLVAIGLENENLFTREAAGIATGPHLVIPLGSLTIVMALQFDMAHAEYFWTRAVLNL